MRRRFWITAGVLSLLGVGVGAYWVGGRNGERGAGAAFAAARPLHSSADNARATIAPSAEARRAGVGRERRETLPPPEAPLRETFADLQARANAGDRGAATRLYRNLDYCRRLRDTNRDYARTSDEMLGEDPTRMSAEELENYQAQLDAIENNRHVLGKRQEACAGVSDAMYGSLVSNIKRAAELGDADARACYLSQGPAVDLRSSIGRPEVFQEYREAVRSMVDAGLAAGDWKTVNVLIDAYQPGSSGVLGGVLGSDAYSYYRYLKLFRLGPGAAAAEKLDSQLASTATELSPTQIADADAWARDAFQGNFQNEAASESVAAEWRPCSFPQE